jgi:alkanesulfonate monooxygenase SsuD/methylene tetrahydromethanopterin reductase-like flavin-dependent oxidoreductase (luciferase family)
VRVGLTLPSFVEDPAVPLAVARTAEESGVDGVFAFDHLFRIATDGSLRPALEATALLGAVAAETGRIAIGALVLRATLRPAARVAGGLDTVARIAGARLIAGIGAGDTQSRAEMETYGLPFGTEADRVTELRAAIRAIRGRGYPIWVGGRVRHVGLIAAESADGWNRWGVTVEKFTREMSEVRALVDRLSPTPTRFTPSWGGLVLLGRTQADAERKAATRSVAPDVIVGGPEQVAEQLQRYVEAGARWVILGPLDSSDPENAAILGELVMPYLRAATREPHRGSA